MKDKEFYVQKELPQEEIERLKQIEYPHLASEVLLNQFNLEGQKILDVGAGPNTKLAEFVAGKKGVYMPLDIRIDMLKEMRVKLFITDIPFFGITGDVKALPFANETFDFVHQRFVLMNIAPETRKKALEEALRVGKENILLLEYNWKTFRSTKNPETIERFKDLAFQMFARFSIDLYMGEKYRELLDSVDPHLNYSLRSFKREEGVADTVELILILRIFYQGAKNVLKDENLAEESRKLREELEKSPIKFVPPEIVTAIIKK